MKGRSLFEMDVSDMFFLPSFPDCKDDEFVPVSEFGFLCFLFLRNFCPYVA